MIGLRQKIIDRIREITDFQEVGGSLSLESVKKDIKRTPACIVILLQSDAEPNEVVSTGTSEQLITDSYGIFVLVDNSRAIKGDDSFDLYEILIDKLKSKLIGWIPTDESYATEYNGGQIVEFAIDEKKRDFDNLIIFSERYKFTYNYCNQLT